MRYVTFFLAVFLFLGIATAQWDEGPDDDDPRWPQDPDDDPTTTRRQPTRTRGPTLRPTPTRVPGRPTTTSEAPPEETEEPEPPVPTGVDTFANATVYQPDDSTHHLTSPRTENFPNKTILAVWNDPQQTNDTISVYQSTNSGFSWYAYGTAKSNVAGRKLLEPHIVYVEGTFSGETNLTLLAVNAVDEKSTNIELYASWDNGATFEFVKRIAEGGPANVATGSTAVGEPSMVVQYVHSNKSDSLASWHAADCYSVTNALLSTTPISATVNTHKRSCTSPRLTFGRIGAQRSMSPHQMFRQIVWVQPASRR